MHEGIDLAVRIGLATGNVAVGDLIGEGASEEANVVGEAPNLAARLQAIAEPGWVVISAATHQLSGGMFETEYLGARDIKGFSDPTPAWRVQRAIRSESRFRATRGAHLTELVGRDEELEVLHRRWRQARDGEGQLVLISGEPGIGKSRLVQAFRDSISGEHKDFRILQCSPHHSSSALFPFLEPSLSAIGITSDATDANKLDKLEAWIKRADQDPVSMAPIFGAFLNIDTSGRYPSVELPPQLQKEKLYEAYSERLRQMSDSRGLVFVVEDAHWIDPSTLELLGMHVAQARGLLNAMIVVTYRPEFDAPWVGQPHSTLIALSRLSRRECATLVTNVSGASELQPDLVEQISARTDGVPLFVEELTKVILDTSSEGLAHADDVPATLHDSLVARLDKLGPAKEVAQLAACIGRSFSGRLLAAVREIPESDIDDTLSPLIESGLVLPERQREGPGFAFKHVMVQQAAYAGLLRTTRQNYHDRIATALIEQSQTSQTPDLIGIAHHQHAANNIEQALVWYRRAAEHATNAGSLREALEIVNRAFEILNEFEGSDNERDRQELELLITKQPVVAALEGYAGDEINRISLRGLDLAIALGERNKESAILFQIATMHEVRGEYALTQATLARRNLLIREPSDSGPIIENGELMACSTFYEGRFDTSIEHATQAIKFSDPLKHSVLGDTLAEEPTIACLFWVAKSLTMQGRIEQARTRHAEAFECARHSPHWYARSQTEVEGALLSAFQRDHAAALDYADQAIESSAEVGLTYREAVARLVREWAGAVGKSFPPSVSRMDQCLGIFREVGAMIGYAFYLSLAAEAHATIGDYDKCGDMIEEAFQLSARSRGFFHESELHRLKGMLTLLRQGESGAADAESQFHTALVIARAQDARLLELRASNAMGRLWIDRNRAKAAHDLIAPIHDWFSEGFDAADLKEARALLDETRKSA
jgi:tetratricopeptide (TPR) repeat protein